MDGPVAAEDLVNIYQSNQDLTSLFSTLLNKRNPTHKTNVGNRGFLHSN